MKIKHLIQRLKELPDDGGDGDVIIMVGVNEIGRAHVQGFSIPNENGNVTLWATRLNYDEGSDA